MKSVYQILKQHGKNIPDSKAILGIDKNPLTYGELFQQARYVINSLNAMGISRNDRVAIVLPNGPEMASTFLTIASAATSAPLNPNYRAKEYEFYLSDLQAKALVIQYGFDSPVVEVAKSLNVPVVKLIPGLTAGKFTLENGKIPDSPLKSNSAQPEDVALVLHTSGTTSRPKIVPLTHINICTSAGNIKSALRLTPDDRCLNIMPLFHIHGLMGATLSTITAGASIVCTPGFYAPDFFEWMGYFHPTWYSAVPTMHQAILSRAESNKDIISKNPLRFLRSSSASLPPQVMKELESIFNAPMIESYGMTEASHQMSTNPLPPGIRKPGSVGLPAGPEMNIMDEEGNLLDKNEIGEIVIRGENVTNGYENNPEANKTAFTKGWFRTGDQGYMDSDGYVFITGRIKELINRGGEKIAPRAVDEVLLSHPDVIQATAFAAPHHQLGEEVAAAVILREGAEVKERELQEFTAKQISDFKVPKKILIVDEIPKGPTGKLQRIGLAEKLGITSMTEEETRQEFVPPRTSLEKSLSDIWSEVLGIDEIGINDNFLQLGGDSMLATQIMSRVRARMGYRLSFLDFLDRPTIANIAVRIESTKPIDKVILDARDETGNLPLSNIQMRLWFLDRFEPGNPAYHRPAYLRLKGKLDTDILRRSLNEIVKRHSVLRARFPERDGQPVQIIDSRLNLEIPVVDISNLSGKEREKEAQRIASDEVKKPFNLAQGPVIRVKIIKIGHEDHILLITFHHIVFDRWSFDILLKELSDLYSAFYSGKSSPLEELPIQYSDYSLWQNKLLEDGTLDEQLSYWLEKLSVPPEPLSLPTDRPRPSILTYRGSRQTLMISRKLLQSLRKLGQREEVTLFMTMLSAFQVLLYRYSRQEDITLGVPVAGRGAVESEELIGSFINTIILRIDLSGEPTFRELLARVKKEALEAYANQDIPFEKIVEQINPERSLSYKPLFQVLFNLENTPKKVEKIRELIIEEYKFDSGIAPFDITLEISEKEQGLSCVFTYNTDLFESSTIQRMLEHFQNLLESLVTNPDERISVLPILSSAEKHLIMREWNETSRDYDLDQCIHQLLEKQAKKTPESTAIVCKDKSLTYRELNARSNQLAHYLKRLGIGPEKTVGICMERSLDMITSIMGILKAGGAYVPMEHNYPEDRLSYMAKDSRMSVILTKSDQSPDLAGHTTSRINIDKDWKKISLEQATPSHSEVKSHNLAYVLYTSGTTGKPKGVAVEHRQLMNYCFGIMEKLDFKPQRSYAMVQPLTVDACITVLFPPLILGGTLHIILREQSLDPRALGEYFKNHSIDYLKIAPSHLEMLLSSASPGEILPKDTLVIGGEASRWKWVKKLQSIKPGCNIYNHYGPTETTVGVTTYHVNNQTEDREYTITPIGKPLPNTQIYILTEQMQPVPIGVTGEIFIGGFNLARCYLNNPEQTENSFIPDPFRDTGRLYKTGDMARYLPDGNIEFLGRVDHQIKIRGFRIEAGEIEVILTLHREIAEALVMAREDTLGDKRLVAYIIPEEGNTIDESDLVDFLRQKLPEHMIPSAFVALDKIPLSAHGKVNIKALPVPERTRDIQDEYIPPQTPVEESLAEIWSDVLGIEKIGIHDNFFYLGGHSLLVTKVVSRIRSVFQINISLKNFFQYPNIAEIASEISRKMLGNIEESELKALLDELEEPSDEE
ncbi:amino acid adenylation domain-containing protein [Candidatus Poribacteria bacterium]|nr:amino acid adenylation domain-containing protein [Candidatus Poribacteria bacterium]